MCTTTKNPKEDLSEGNTRKPGTTGKPTRMKAKVVKKKAAKKASNLPAKTQPANAQVVHKVLADLAQRKKMAGPQFKTWSDSLFAIYENMAGLMAVSGLTELMSNYQIGNLFNVAIAQKAYGAGVGQKLATELNEPLAKLRDCGHLARVWTFPDFQALLKRRGARGPMKYSHLLIIAKREDEVERADLIERVFNDRLTVDELKAAIQVKKTPTLPVIPDAEAPVDKTKLGIIRAIDKSGVTPSGVPLEARDWQSRVADPLEENPECLNEDVAEMLREKQCLNRNAIISLEKQNQEIDVMLKNVGLPTFAKWFEEVQQAEQAKSRKATKPAGRSKLDKALNKTGRTASAEIEQAIKTKGGK